MFMSFWLVLVYCHRDSFLTLYTPVVHIILAILFYYNIPRSTLETYREDELRSLATCYSVHRFVVTSTSAVEEVIQSEF